MVAEITRAARDQDPHAQLLIDEYVGGGSIAAEAGTVRRRRRCEGAEV